ncbi:MAG: hypothetical protein EOO90_16620 [Pedobacter sp.]|nr:MAG: hypothetical protein EOO90_16620 [Pedobacter sp.]
MKKLTLLFASSIIAGILFTACNNGNSNSSEATSAKEKETSELIGKAGLVTFPQFKVSERFVSDSVLHWQIVDEKGTVTEADEKISFKKLNDHQFFVSWIEKTGLTVSQVLDVKNQIATAFVSRDDEKSERGQRSANFLEGSFVIDK